MLKGLRLIYDLLLPLRAMTIRVSKTLLEHAEKSFTVLALLLFTQALLNSSQYPWAGISSLLRGISWVGIYGTVFFLGTLHWKHLIRVATRDKLLLLLLGMALLSFLWSDMPGTAMKNAVSLAITSLFGVYFAMRYSLKEQLRLLAWMYGVVVLLSLVFVLLLPAYGVSGPFWVGVYQQKNILGRQMIVSAIVFLLTAFDLKKYRWVAWSGFALSVILLLGTNSKTALVTLLAVMVLLPLYRALRWNYTIAIPIYITAILVSGGVAVWFLDNVESVFTSLGKDTTLTGRLPLWDVLSQKIFERLWLGYGPGVFWSESDSTSGYVHYVVEWQAPSAHNVYLDVWLDLGLIGLLLFVLGFLMCCLRAVAHARITKTADGLWPLAYLTIIFLFSPVQSLIPATHSIFWILYVTITLSTPIRLASSSQQNLYQSITSSSTRQVKDL